MNEDRFVTFEAQGAEHTYRLMDIQAVGVGKDDREQSYIQVFGIPLIVARNEAIRVRKLWIQEG